MLHSEFPGFQDLKLNEDYPCKIDAIKNEEFVRTLGSTYVDHAASTLYSERQLDDIFSSFKSLILSNPHSRHLPSDLTTEAIESIRNRILHHFNTKYGEYDVIFTFGATDAIKVVGNYFNWSSSKDTSEPGGIYAYTEESHTSVIGLRELASAKGAEIYCIEIDTVTDRLQDTKEKNASDDSLFKDSFENCLFCYPAQSNFSGTKYPLSWIKKIHEGQLRLDEPPLNSSMGNYGDNKVKNRVWYVLLDAASLVATAPLDLTKYKPDFVPISFYKIFGYPTGLGCLLVSKRAWHCLRKPYFGGGTVLMADSKSMAVHRRITLHQQFEDGTLPFLDIISLQQGFNSLLRITGRMENIEKHVFNLSRYLIYNLRSLKHGNGRSVAEVYSNPRLLTVADHGSIVNFNLKYSSGDYVGFSHVEKVSSISNIYLRTGCVCNPGGCQKYLNISSEKMKRQFEAGHVCGDLHDLVDGCPTGSVRVSFGYMSTYDDVDAVLHMIKECFVEGHLVFDASWYKPEDEVNCDIKAKATEKMQNGLNSNVVHNIVDNFRDESQLSSDNRSRLNALTATRTIDLEHSSNLVETKADTSIEKPSSSLLLTDIIVYPIKSCAGICVSKWPVGPLGLKYDRQWAIVTSSGVTLTLKRNAELSRLKPWIDEERNILTLSFEGFDSVSVDLSSTTDSKPSTESKFCSGRVCGDKINGLDCGDEVALWLSSVFRMNDIRLVRQVEARKCKLLKDGSKVKEELSLANESQYLAIHRPSLRHLIQEMTQNRLHHPIPPEEELKLRFRPNFVFDGGLPYEEDTWDSFTLEDYHFKVLGNCIRCQMVCVNPKSGERSKEPMLTLGKARGPSMPFGVHASFYADGNGLSGSNSPADGVQSSCLRVGTMAFITRKQNDI